LLLRIFVFFTLVSVTQLNSSKLRKKTYQAANTQYRDLTHKIRSNVSLPSCKLRKKC